LFELQTRLAASLGNVQVLVNRHAARVAVAEPA